MTLLEFYVLLLPNLRLYLEEIKNHEDELIVDNTPDSPKSEVPINEILDEPNTANDHDIFEVSHDENDIPNNEILSNDEIVTEIETLMEDPGKATVLEEDFEELSRR